MSKIKSKVKIKSGLTIDVRLALSIMIVSTAMLAFNFAAAMFSLPDKEVVVKQNINQKITGIVELLTTDDFENNIATYLYSINVDGVRYDLQSPDKQLSDYVGKEVIIDGSIKSDVIIANSIQDTLSKNIYPAVLGEQKYVVVYLLDGTEDPSFDAQAYTNLHFEGANDFIIQESMGGANISALTKTVFFTTPLCSSFDVKNYAIEAIDAEVDFNQYDGIIIYLPYNSCLNYTAVGSVGKWEVSTDDGLLPLYYVIMNGYSSSVVPSAVLGHEIGHNFGFAHSASLECGEFPYRKPLDSECYYYSYGDRFNIMGGGTYSTHYSLSNKLKAGWIADKEVIIANLGTYALASIENSDGFMPRGIKIPILWDAEDIKAIELYYQSYYLYLAEYGVTDYFLEYWSDIDMSWFSDEVFDCPDNTYGLSPSDVERGLLIRVGADPEYKLDFSLTMHPNTEVCWGSDIQDSCRPDSCLNMAMFSEPFKFLLEGETYYDQFNNMKITLLSAGDETATVKISRIYDDIDAYEIYEDL
ncbi:MAG: hypothetical protein HOE19_00525 [Candidatus Komeilibacteria bacterium]|jgi:hypothetical protein|nr:hypothetical protein [Candidatus Komeilibacteria bacterium]MBT4447383.1 hypothetical protein [Candidatus Komeilibacteria bacterium]